MVARFMPALYHCAAPYGEIGEAGANGEYKANLEIGQDAMPNSGKHPVLPY
jgi:hypothetical protein